MTPYVSFVATSRNDDHGGNLLDRMQIFVQGLMTQCERHSLDAELVLVEWNPPPDKARLREALQWPSSMSKCKVRIFEVPPEVHRKLKLADQLPLFQMMAKNVGIRRACGEFILATNIDVLFSDELMEFLAARRLKKGRMYRIDRYDVPMPVGSTIEEHLEFCRNHVVRVNRREGSTHVESNSFHAVYSRLTWPDRIHEWMQDHGFRRVVSYTKLHTNTCGDFTLMNRDHWFCLRGYPQLEMYSFHLDSILCHAAHHLGARESVLRDPMRIYHIEHAPGSGWTPEGKQELTARLAAKEIPKLEHSQFAAWALEMRKKRSPMLFNGEDWGFAEYEFPESSIFQ